MQAQVAPSREYQLKAVFLFNFTQFVEWPTTAFSSSSAPFVIGVLGDDPFGSYLDETVANEKMMGHPITIQRYRQVKDIRSCHILFIHSTNMAETQEALSMLNNRHTLTVSDQENFAQLGGMIRFFTKDNKTKLQINLEAAKAVRLIISSKLLRVSEIFGPANN